MSRGWCRISPERVLGIGRMGPVVTRINIYLLWGRGGGAWSCRAEQSYREQAWLLVGPEVWFPQRSRQEGRRCRREDKAIKCAALPRTGSPCLSRNTTRLWPRRPPPGSHRFTSASCSSRGGGSDSNWLWILGSQSKAKDADRSGLANQVLNAWHLCKPRATSSSNLRADRSMICVQSEAAKVSRHHAQTTSTPPPPLPPFSGGFLTPMKPLQFPPSYSRDPPFYPPSFFSREVQLLAWGGSPPWRWDGIPKLGYIRLTRPSWGPRRETKKPPNGFAAPPPPLGALPVARRCQGRGRRDLRNPPSQPTPTAYEPTLGMGL